MELKNLKSLDEALNQQIKDNKKYGGSGLKNIMKRPDRNGEGSGLIHLPGQSLPTDKCKCGGTKFVDQEVCGDCYWKNKKND